MKKERLQQTMQKYKGLSETVMNNYMAIKWITWNRQILRKFSLPRLNQEEIEIKNNPNSSSKTEAVNKHLPKNKSSGLDGFSGEFYQTSREELMLLLLKLIQKVTEETTLPNSFYEATIKLTPKPDTKKKTTGQYH